MRKGFQFFQIQEMFLAARTNKDFQRATVMNGLCRNEIHWGSAIAACDESNVLARFPLIAGAKRTAHADQISDLALRELLRHRAHGEERDLGLRTIIKGD